MKTKFFLFVTLAALFLAACSEVSYEGPEKEILLDSFLSTPVTKASSNGPLNLNGSSAVAMPTDNRTLYVSAYYSDANNSSYNGNYFTDIPFTYASGAWRGSGNYKKYWPATGTLAFLAFTKEGLSPTITHNSNNTAGLTYPMPNNISNQEDVMMAYKTAVSRPSGNSVALAFKHAQAVVCFTAAAAAGAAYDGTNNYGFRVTNVQLLNACYSGTITATVSDVDNISFAWSSQGSRGDRSFPSVTGTNLGTSASACGTTGILVPGQATNGNGVYILITYELHNGKAADNSTNVTTTMTYKYPVTTEWTAGNKYTYAFTFNLNEITCSATVSNWSAGTGDAPSI